MPEQEDDRELALKRDIAREIEEAFADVPYPGDDRLLAYPNYYESAYILEFFPGKHWRELVCKIPPEHDVSVVLFSAEAFRFYIPAYVITTLLDPPEYGIFEEYTTGALDPSQSKSRRRAWFLDYISPLDARQKAALRRFIEFTIPEAIIPCSSKEDRTLYFWQRIADLDRIEATEAREQDSTLQELRKVLLGESPLSEQEAREVKDLEQEIAREVEEAFATVTLPVDDGSPASKVRWRDVPEEFRDKPWKALSREVLKHHRIRYYSPEAFRFFVPAYLLAALLHSEDDETGRDEIFYDLMPPREHDHLMKKFLARAHALDARQQAVVRRYVELWVRTAALYPDVVKEQGLSF